MVYNRVLRSLAGLYLTLAALLASGCSLILDNSDSSAEALRGALALLLPSSSTVQMGGISFYQGGTGTLTVTPEGYFDATGEVHLYAVNAFHPLLSSQLEFQLNPAGSLDLVGAAGVSSGLLSYGHGMHFESGSSRFVGARTTGAAAESPMFFDPGTSLFRICAEVHGETEIHRLVNYTSLGCSGLSSAGDADEEWMDTSGTAQSPYDIQSDRMFGIVLRDALLRSFSLNATEHFAH